MKGEGRNDRRGWWFAGLCAVALLAGSAGSLAAGMPGSVAIAPKIGTLGFGGDLTVGLNEKLNGRLSFSTFSWDIHASEEEDGEENLEGDDEGDQIDASLDWQSFGALLDWHPTGGGFRLTAGALVNNNEVTLSAIPGDTVELNDVDYSVDRLDGSVTFAKLAPYIGIGVGNAVSEEGRLHFAFDLGVMIQGAPDIEASATASDPMLQDVLNADLDEEVREIEDDAKVFNWYPVIAFGVSFRF